MNLIKYWYKIVKEAKEIKKYKPMIKKKENTYHCIRANCDSKLFESGQFHELKTHGNASVKSKVLLLLIHQEYLIIIRVIVTIKLFWLVI